MTIKDIIDIVEQNEYFKTSIKIFKSVPETYNMGKELENKYRQWLDNEV